MIKVTKLWRTSKWQGVLEPDLLRITNYQRDSDTSCLKTKAQHTHKMNITIKTTQSWYNKMSHLFLLETLNLLLHEKLTQIWQLTGCKTVNYHADLIRFLSRNSKSLFFSKIRKRMIEAKIELYINETKQKRVPNFATKTFILVKRPDKWNEYIFSQEQQTKFSSFDCLSNVIDCFDRFSWYYLPVSNVFNSEI